MPNLIREFFYQAVFVVYYVFEKLGIFLIRANLCCFLSYTTGTSEMLSTFHFHIFQFITYFTAFIFGQISLVAYKPIFFLALLGHFGAFIAILISYIQMGEEPVESVFIWSVLTILAFTNGLNLVSFLRSVEMEMEKTAAGSTNTFLATLGCEIVGNLMLPSLFWSIEIGGAILFLTTFTMAYIVILIGLEVTIIILYVLDSDRFEEYDSYQHNLCLLYRLVLPLYEYVTTTGRQKKRERKEKKLIYKEALVNKKLGYPLTEDQQIALEEEPKRHWLDIVSPPYPESFVSDLKAMIRYWKLLIVLPGIFIAFEIRYSFWLFSYSKLRLSWSWIPTQFILSIQQIVIVIFIPVYTFWIYPIFRRSWFKRPLRRIVLGAFFVLMSVIIGMLLFIALDQNNNHLTEPYFYQSKIVIRNGMDCRFVLNDKLSLNTEQGFLERMQNSLIFHPINFAETVEDTYGKHHNEEFMDKLENFNNFKEHFYPMKKIRGTDTMTYYLSDKGRDVMIQSLSVFPVGCPHCSATGVPVLGTTHNELTTSKMFLLLVQPWKIETLSIPFVRPRETKPGIRFLFANRTTVPDFRIIRDNIEIHNFPKLIGLDTKYIFFKDGDGPNIEFAIGHRIFKPDFDLEMGSLYDFVFVEREGMIEKLKVYENVAPFKISHFYGVLQYTFLAMGELLFGVFGLRFFLRQTPIKLRTHALSNWHFMFALANLIILVVVRSGLVLTAYWQLGALTIIFAFSLFLFIIFAAQYKYKPFFSEDEPIPIFEEQEYADNREDVENVG